MEDSVRPEIYGVMPVKQVESMLRGDKMPAPFIRRMRVINLLSALTLRKIEDDMIAPFEVMDIHHVLNEQISQDAIIAMLENKNLALALETGNLQPLWVESKEKPLLRKGFEQGWIQRFNSTPFDPICVMLAMRAKLMLDVVDEMGHSYDLLRSLGMGWIDFGEIPGEEIGDPDSYIPPLIDTPIDYPDLPPDPVPGDPDYVPGPGEPGYISPGDLVPGDPGYAPGPSDPGYIPPGDLVPGEPGYVPTPGDQNYIPPADRVPGDPGYGGVPGEPAGYPEGWDEGIVPGHPDYDPGPGERGHRHRMSPGGGYYGGDYGPGGPGIEGGPYGTVGIYGSLAAPLTLGYGPGDLLSRGWGKGIYGYARLDCCIDYTDPDSNVGLAYETDTMSAGEEQTLSVYHADPLCDGDNYEWLITAGGGELSALSGLEVIYTAPADGHGCPGNTEVTLYCDGNVMAVLDITFDYVYVVAYDYGTSAEEIVRETSETVYVMANNTPLTWSVSGTGFSLEHEETEGLGNVLHADETACGSATITVTGCDGQQATGYVRCTTGQWVLKSNECVLSGPGEIGIVGNNYYAIRIEGNKRQGVDYSVWSSGNIQKADPEQAVARAAAIAEAESHCVPDPCLSENEIDCTSFYSGFYTVNMGCTMNNLGCRTECDCSWSEGEQKWTCSLNYAVWYTKAMSYKEWEC